MPVDIGQPEEIDLADGRHAAPGTAGEYCAPERPLGITLDLLQQFRLPRVKGLLRVSPIERTLLKSKIDRPRASLAADRLYLSYELELTLDRTSRPLTVSRLINLVTQAESIPNGFSLLVS